ncbi:hypothetical protein Moror_387 [Moniliophthora roreri MCA 2997]|uniref:Uncharacterized protein n=1 Tax=Moniliophthora roreri (strain MCA 2997) TaxID=1381753 RepID=V2XZ77_MONRO|nr:hypothetical protein Moror_387 [Moniliophthora roreri MCA 2997]
MSALSPSTSRNWWQLSSKSSKDTLYPSEKTPSRDKRTDGKFNTFASAIGLSTKSKKHPSLAIQSPPPSFTHQPPPQGDPSYSPKKYTNRPPSKSVSSTRSRVDSIEPRTPSDPRSSGSQRHSLLTLSDTDPFAARNVSGLTSPLDPNRLSAYSNSSIPDYTTKKLHVDVPANRGSYASSSSNSNSNMYPEDMSIISSPSWITELPVHNHALPKKKSAGDFGRGTHHLLETAWDDIVDPTGSTMTKSHSSSTLTDKNRLSQPNTSRLPRPPMRARGMTDVGPIPQRSKFLQDDTGKAPSPRTTPDSFVGPSNSAATSPISPRVVVRQPSIQRMGLPLTAPPNQKLPLPPVNDNSTDDDTNLASRLESRHRDSVASTFSSLSLGREIPNQHYIPRNKARERSLMSQPEGLPEGATPSSKSSSPTRTLKRATSQQSLKGSNGSSFSRTVTEPIEKAPRKQRSFHHPRIPLPPMPMPLRHTNSFNNSPSQSAEFSTASTGEGKRDSTSGPSSTPVRKRLFSASSLRRPSTSHSPASITAEDDVRSIFSLSMDSPERNLYMTSSRPTPNPQSASFWEDPDPPSSPQATHVDYTPQQIMSPADMLKFEASVQESLSSSRARGLSVVSSSTVLSTSESEYAPSVMSLQPPPSVMSQNSLGSPQELGRSHSLVGRDFNGGTNMLYSKSRPSTSQGPAYLHSPIDSVESFSPFSPSSSPPPEFVSLPPPPRPRRGTALHTHSNTPPPSASASDVPALKPLAPPPRKQSLPTPTHKQMSRRSIMKKPSFLHIDDDVPDQSRPLPTPPPPPPSRSTGAKLLKHEDSFLDFARESLDTLRSDTDDRY